MSDERVPLLVVDDDAIVRAWLRYALEGSELRIAGEAGSVAEGLALAGQRYGELLLVDYRLPDGLGTELVRTLRAQGAGTPVLIMTAAEQEGLNESAREAGAQGTILKNAHADELLRILRALRFGGVSFDPHHPRRQPGRTALSGREREVLRLIAAGATNVVIAKSLDIEAETVKTLVGRCFVKLGVHKRAEAVSEAQRLGLI